MTRFAPFVVAIAAVMLVPLGSALAQPSVPGGGGAQRPAFSPYLNLLRGGSPALNYFGLVRPQQQFQQQFGQLQQQLQTTNNSLQQLTSEGVFGVDPNLPLTGHGAVFNNTGHYFNSNPANGGGAGGNRFGSFGGGMGIPRGPSGAGAAGASRPGGAGGASNVAPRAQTGSSGAVRR